MRALPAILLVLATAAAAAAPVTEPIPLPRPRPVIYSEPKSFVEANDGLFDVRELTAEPSDCRARLDELAAVVETVPRLIGPGACGNSDMVRLEAVMLPDKSRVDVVPPPVLTCRMAESVIAWLRDEVAPRMSALGTKLRAIDNYDSYDCRGRNRVFGAKLSEHGNGNALDVRAFKLANGELVGLTDTAVDKELRTELRQSACARFTTVLGPGSDSHHESHIHLDQSARRGGHRICQWAVREPPPPVEVASVPLPRPCPAFLRVKTADTRKL